MSGYNGYQRVGQFSTDDAQMDDIYINREECDEDQDPRDERDEEEQGCPDYQRYLFACSDAAPEDPWWAIEYIDDDWHETEVAAKQEEHDGVCDCGLPISVVKM